MRLSRFIIHQIFIQIFIAKLRLVAPPNHSRLRISASRQRHAYLLLLPEHELEQVVARNDADRDFVAHDRNAVNIMAEYQL